MEILDFLIVKLSAAPLPSLVIGGLLATLMLLFLALYFLPGVFFWWRSKRLLGQLRGHEAGTKAGMSQLFSTDKRLAHLWREYEHTLHEQRELNAQTGAYQVVALRATVPAESFFNTQALVDTRLRTEFFKHLPGIFTGLGIIGTFWGLIGGLKAFQVSENPQIVRESLNVLVHGVFEAFLISASAIALAMIVTFFEKWLIAALYRLTEELVHVLDGLFESGAGEEYLARLVKASEDSASQTKILKDSLVADLRQILTELTQQQIRASAEGNKHLGEQIVGSLQTGLKDPLDKISDAVGRIGGSHEDAIKTVLTDAIASLTQRIQDLFGGQISGINDLQQKTVAALQTAAAKLEQMANSVDAAGQHATEQMTAKLTQAMGTMEARQQVMNDRMAEFVEQIRVLVRDSQVETNQQLREAIGTMNRVVSDMVAALKQQAESSGVAHEERERRIGQATSEVMSSMSGQVENVLAKVGELSTDIKASVDSMRSSTSEVVGRMNAGADTLHAAAAEFARAGQGVSGALAQATGITDKLSQAANAVGASTKSLEAVVTDYKMTREMVAEMLSQVQSVVEAAKKEAAITADVLGRIEGAAAKLTSAQQEADTYLMKVSEVLTQTHHDFATNLTRTLREGNRQFYDQLSTATGLLKEAIEELQTTLADVSVRT